jgi:hypothetical protein
MQRRKKEMVNKSQSTIDRISKKKEAWKLLRFKKKSNNNTKPALTSNEDRAGNSNVEPSVVAVNHTVGSPLSVQALKVLGPPSFYQSEATANGSSISFGPLSSSKLDEIFQELLS